MAFQPNVNTYTQGFGSSNLSVQSPHIDVRAPTANDINYPVGKRWINKIGNATYTLTSFSSSAGVTTANWQTEGGGTVALDTLSGDTGTATPVDGNINILGTANQISTVGASDDITLSFSTPNFTLSTTLAKLESSAGGTSNIITASNLSDTANSGAGFNSLVAGGSAGDPYHFYQIGAGQAWVHGIDNSDGDSFVISASTALGTSNVMRMSNAGAVSFTLGNVDITRSAAGSTVLETISNTNNANAASHAQLNIVTGGASGGDPTTKYSISGVQDWTIGVDNSNSDAFTIAASGALGTTNIATFFTTGNVRLEAGDLQLTNGDVLLETAGNKLGIATGANASVGTATFPTAASVTVNTTAVNASSLIFVQLNTSVMSGSYAVPSASIVAGTSFVITSTSATDQSTVNWWIIN